MFNGTLYEVESKWNQSWLGKMKDYRDSELVEKKWKTRKPGEQKSENQTSTPKLTYRNSSTMLDKSSKQYEDFQWMHHKGEVLCAVGCFSLIVLAVLLINFATGGFIVSFAIPWILTASLSFSLFACLFLCYESSQIACRYIDRPVLCDRGFYSSSSSVYIRDHNLPHICNPLHWIFGSHPDKQLYATIKALEKSLCELKLNEQAAIHASEQNKEEYADKINQMRQFIETYNSLNIAMPFNAVALGIGHMLAGSLSVEQQEILKMMDASSSSMIRILNGVLDIGPFASRTNWRQAPHPPGGPDMLFSMIGLTLYIGCMKCEVFFMFKSRCEFLQIISQMLRSLLKFTPRNGKVRLRVVCHGTYTADPGLIKQLEAFPQNGIGQKCKFCYLDQEKEKDLLFKEKQPAFISVTLCVEDTGIGISKEDQARLFEPYIQIKAGSVQGGGGTGLGLCFSRRSRIPVLLECNQKLVKGVASHLRCLLSWPHLCQETETQNPFDFQTIGGGLVRTISLGKFAGSSLIGHKPKVIMELVSQTDKSCSRVGLYRERATRLLRAMAIKAPIVGSTGNALDGDRNQFLAAGVDNFFTKPILRHQLFRRLEAHGLVIR
eukprot:Gb_10948 [translate_table: standard]